MCNSMGGQIHFYLVNFGLKRPERLVHPPENIGKELKGGLKIKMLIQCARLTDTASTN